MTREMTDTDAEVLETTYIDNQKKLTKILTRFERRFGYWEMKSDSWRRAVEKYGRKFMLASDGNYYSVGSKEI